MPTQNIISKYVVALPDSNRLPGFLEQSAARDFEVFPAFDGRDGAVPTFVDLSAYASRIGRAPLGGEIGCAASHFLLMTQFAEAAGANEDLMLVAEDDARFYPDFESALFRIVRRWRPISLALLAHPSENSPNRNFTGLSERSARISALSTPIALRGVHPVMLGATRGMLIGTGLYLISRRSCRQAIRYIRETHNGSISWHADAYDVWADPAGIRLDLARPNLAGWEGASQIGGEDHPGPSVTNTPASDTRHNRGRLIRGIPTRIRRSVDAVRIVPYDLRHWHG